MSALTIAPFLDAPDRPFLSPTIIDQAQHLQLGELATAAGDHRSTLTARPQAPRVQAFLRVVDAAREIFGDDALPVACLSKRRR